MVLYVVVGFRAGYPEVSPRNMTFSTLKQSGMFGAGAPGTEIHKAVAPAQGEVVVTKHRVGAFLGTDLEMVLRANGIETMVLAGIATSGVVLSTLRHAADADFRIVVAAGLLLADRDGGSPPRADGEGFPAPGPGSKRRRHRPGARCLTGVRPAPYIPRLAGLWQRSSVVEQGNHNPLVGGSNPSAATSP